MNCPNCGTFNAPNYRFCIKCGQSIANEVPQSIPVQPTGVINQNMGVENMNNMQVQNQNNYQTVTPSTFVNNYSYSNVNESTNIKSSIMDYFFIILAVILKPFTALKQELSKFNKFKNSAILSLMVSGFATLIQLITAMLNVVKVKSFDFSKGGYKTEWVFENLKDLDYIEIIGKNLLIWLGVIAAIGTVYYVGSFIVKKQTNFSRLLGLSALAVTPILICSLILSPLLSMISLEIAMGVTIIGAVYTIIILYEGMSNEVLLDGNIKYYFNLICLSILGIAAYYLYMKLMMSSISFGFENILDLLG